MIKLLFILVILFVLMLIIFNVKVDDDDPEQILIWYTFRNQRKYFVLWKS